MHIIFNEDHYLDNSSVPIDLNQEPADLVILSFSDSDLNAFANAWKKTLGDFGRESVPTLRLANIKQLTHNLSIDTYIEKTVSKSKGILVRLIGGEQYWPYGLNYLKSVSIKKKIPLAVIPADGREDKVLDSYSNLPKSTLENLKNLCDDGGELSAQAVLAQMALAASLHFPAVTEFSKVKSHGFYCYKKGILENFTVSTDAKPTVCIIFYRSYLMADDLEPIDQLFRDFKKRDIKCISIFVNSLKIKSTAKWIESMLSKISPIAILNATAFSAKSHETGKSPLDHVGVPVFQIILSTSKKESWRRNPIGLNSSDLAMHVAIPEVDGRINGGIVSFKSEQAIDPALQFPISKHKVEKTFSKKIINKVEKWHALRSKKNEEKRIAIVLSSYPGRDFQLAHALGLDTIKSTKHILGFLGDNGFKFSDPDKFFEKLKSSRIEIPIKLYERLLNLIPLKPRTKLFKTWGGFEEDAFFEKDKFVLQGYKNNNFFVLVQPSRGLIEDKKADYHDLEKIPCHSYVAMYLWLQMQNIDAFLHMGTHGSLEWLPGKTVGLSNQCWPELLVNDIPFIYPFIVNDPGEASQAKRRLGALTVGHMPPKIQTMDLPNELRDLEFLLDEYSTSGDLDQVRKEHIEKKIIHEAKKIKLDKELSVDPITSDSEWLTRIDSFVCDLKESQFSSGLHIFGKGDCGASELNGLLRCLEGKRINSGPSGSPYRNRTDIKPTGRNIYAVDPRSIPTKIAFQNGQAMADEFVRQYLQDNGDYPKNLTIDLWGSASMRTGGQEYSMALAFAGLTPIWDKNNARILGFSILSLAELGRPRIDITIRQSGLFRDIFPELNRLFFDAIDKLHERDETLKDNPYKNKVDRIFAPKPGSFGVNIKEKIEGPLADHTAKIGEAWIKSSAWAYQKNGKFNQNTESLKKRLADTEALIHSHDLCESDLLSAKDYADHIGGFNAAVASMQKTNPKLYHLDISSDGIPKVRTTNQELARIIRGKLSDDKWVSGMLQHGYRGAAEITELVFNLSNFGKSGVYLPNHLIELVYNSTLANTKVADFMAEENIDALKGLENTFSELRDLGLWKSFHNSIRYEERLVENG